MLLCTGCWFGSRGPTTITLMNVDGQVIGQAFAMEDAFWTADHIYRTHENLFFEGTPIEVLERSVRRDVLRFSLPFRGVKDKQSGSLSADFLRPGIRLSWSGGQGTLERIETKFVIGDREYHRIGIVSGKILPGMSGLPVLDDAHNVRGMIIGGDNDSVFISELYATE